MKIVIAYPPLNNHKGVPTLGQNRQFQYFKKPTYIYPVVPAEAATLLKEAGYQVIWLDCIAEGLSQDRFFEIIKEERPDIVVFETKTPVVKQHWKIIDALNALRTTDYELRTVLFGDHVTALPEESFQNSGVDYVLTGGDYDFLLLNLCNYLKVHGSKFMVHGLEPGIYYRENGQVKSTGKFQLDHDLDLLPFIDRDLTKWQLYAYENGNYKRTPGTYITSGRDCWWGRCSFCSWPQLYPTFRSRSVENVLNEISILVQTYGVREIMDDTGSFPVGDWLQDFCRGMNARGLDKRIYLDCNMRFGALTANDFSLMRKSGFRLVLFGLESVNQSTLDRLDKGLKVEKIIEDCKAASTAGLSVHITVMFGYPWESYEDALKTMKLAKWLLKKGYAYTMQATVVIPYPGSMLFKECKEKGWLKTFDWDEYDMKAPVMRGLVSDEKIMGLVRNMYQFSFSPGFMLKKAGQISDMDDLRYSLRVAKKVFGHIFDFK